MRLSDVLLHSVYYPLTNLMRTLEVDMVHDMPVKVKAGYMTIDIFQQRPVPNI